MRFNNILAAIILGLAALAAAIALAGFCFGCFLFYQFKLKRARLFGTPMRWKSEIRSIAVEENVRTRGAMHDGSMNARREALC